MNSEQEIYSPRATKPETQDEKPRDAFQELASYLDELGLFKLGNVDQPLSIEAAKDFRASLSPEQRKRLRELETAFNEN